MVYRTCSLAPYIMLDGPIDHDLWAKEHDLWNMFYGMFYWAIEHVLLADTMFDGPREHDLWPTLHVPTLI